MKNELSMPHVDAPSLMQAQISFGAVSYTDKTLFAKHLSIMLKAGLTLGESLQITIQSARGPLKRILDGLVRSVDAGRPFSDALEEYPRTFSQLFVSSVRTGENSGTLAENLEHMAKELQKEKVLHDKIRGALLYPMVVLIATFLLGISLTFLVLLKITPLFTGLHVELPASTRALIWFSGLVQKHGLILFASITGAFLFLLWLVRQSFMEFITHWISLRAPVLKRLIHNANLARFCRTLGLLLKSGLTISEALEVTGSALQNFYFRKSVDAVRARVEKGVRLSDNLALYPFLYPPVAIHMIRVGEESGNLSDTLTYLSDFYETEIETATKSLATIIEPVLLLFVGCVVGFLAISIITPIYDITGNIQQQ